MIRTLPRTHTLWPPGQTKHTLFCQRRLIIDMLKPLHVEWSDLPLSVDCRLSCRSGVFAPAGSAGWLSHLGGSPMRVGVARDTPVRAREREPLPLQLRREMKPIVGFYRGKSDHTATDVIPRHIWESSRAHMILKNLRNSEWVLEPDLFIFVHVQSFRLQILTPKYYEYNEEMLETNRENK